ncbi:condensation domain-containing protein [Streptomyces sp. M19]
MAGRHDASLHETVGCFVNTVVLRTDLSGAPTFAELLARVRAIDLDAFAHQRVPFERVVEAVNPPRSLSGHPVFQVMLAFQDTPRWSSTCRGAGRAGRRARRRLAHGPAVEPAPAPRGRRAPAGSRACWSTTPNCSPRLGPAAARPAGTAAAGGGREPAPPVADLPVLLPGERERVVGRWNATVRDVPETTVADLFAAQALRAPDTPAVLHGETVLSYRELAERAARIAAELTARGPGPGAGRGAAAARSRPARHVPRGPGDRRRLPARRPLAAAGADRGPAGGRPPAAGGGPRRRTHRRPGADAPALLPAATAYVTYTSGSTGRPKGSSCPTAP